MIPFQNPPQMPSFFVIYNRDIEVAHKNEDIMMKAARKSC